MVSVVRNSLSGPSRIFPWDCMNFVLIIDVFS
jgi:hypothetical protein